LAFQKHLYDPRSVSDGSLSCQLYPWCWGLETYDTTVTAAKIRAILITLGVPYEEKDYPERSECRCNEASPMEIVKKLRGLLKKDGFEVSPDREIVALIALLQTD